MAKQNISIKNRKAKFEYEFLEEFEAGMQLLGTEIKSIRESKASIMESYCFFSSNEVFIKNMHIAEYDNGGYANHEPRRTRKLLLTKNEIKKIEKKLKDKGITLIPFLLFINDKGLAKLKIALARGKKLFDKRESIKEKDLKRQFDRKQII